MQPSANALPAAGYNYLTVIAANNGLSLQMLLSEVGPGIFTNEKEVQYLASTSPEYQRHVVERARKGDRNPVRPIAATLLVYDTVSFRDVTRRLYRALGTIRSEAAHLTRSIERDQPDYRLADRLLTLDLVAEQASLLRDLLIVIDPVTGTMSHDFNPCNYESAPPDRLHAASGLGLIAKNVRNVAVLQSEHRPNREQKELALRLSTEVLELAMQTGMTARRAFGAVDSKCRVQSTPMPTRRVITHDKLDGDAIGAAWLAERFLFANESVEILFVPRGRVLGAWRRGDCLVDVGYTHDAGNLFFDHKVPSGKRFAPCAAGLLWERLMGLGNPLTDLQPPVEAILLAGGSLFAGSKSNLRQAYKEGNVYHRLLADAKSRYGNDDASVYRLMRTWLDQPN